MTEMLFQTFKVISIIIFTTVDIFFALLLEYHNVPDHQHTSTFSHNTINLVNLFSLTLTTGFTAPTPTHPLYKSLHICMVYIILSHQKKVVTGKRISWKLIALSIFKRNLKCEEEKEKKMKVM